MFQWNGFHDHDICSWISGRYLCTRPHGATIGYYFRCPGKGTADYARQLVYTADNRLLAGLGRRR